jgi:hypothetical protein
VEEYWQSAFAGSAYVWCLAQPRKPTQSRSVGAIKNHWNYRRIFLLLRRVLTPKGRDNIAQAKANMRVSLGFRSVRSGPVPEGPDESSPASAAADWVSVSKKLSVPDGTIDEC